MLCPESALKSGAGNFAGAEASGADVNVGRSAVNDCLHALHVGLPGTVGTAMGVGNLDAEGDALTAETALCHFAYPLTVIESAFQFIILDTKTAVLILSDAVGKIKSLSEFFSKILPHT